MQQVDFNKIDDPYNKIHHSCKYILETSGKLHFRKSMRSDLVLIDILEQDAKQIYLDAMRLVCIYKKDLNDADPVIRKNAENDYENVCKKIENYWIKILHIEMFFEEWISVKKALKKNETWSFIKERATYISPYKYRT